MGLRDYIIRRVAYCLILLMLVMTLNYLIFMIMPGDPVTMFISPYLQRGGDPKKAQEIANSLRELWGINDPPLQRYFKYIQNMLTWNFGITFQGRESVATEMQWRVPYTLVLLGGSTAFAIIMGVVLGAIAAERRGGRYDGAAVTTSLIFYSLPTFWMGLLLIFVFYCRLGWLPNAFAHPAEWALYPPHPYTVAASSTSSLGVLVTVNPGDLLTTITGYIKHAFLPVTVLTLFQYGGFLLLVRATMIEALTEDYIVTARAKGVTERSVVFRHALKNASLPLITSIALSFGFILSGAIITETVFSWPGLGRWIFDSINVKDFNILQATFYIIALCVILANFIADLLYGVIDPRIKY